jgi:2-methylcitrate dehydratase PrpD
MGLLVNESVGPTQVLADFVAHATWSQIPPAVQARVRDIVMDTIASALGGHDAAESPMVLSTAELVLGSGRSTVIGGGAMSPAAATVANGYLITAVNLCDVHHPTLCHVTPEVIPPALAVAGERSVSGADFLTAVALGLEVTTRIGVGAHYEEFRRRGWHSPGVTGPFGGAASAGRLLGLDAGAIRNAFGLAGSQAAGSFAQLGTPTIKFSQARAALGGLLSAKLAAAGMAAAAEILTNPVGGLYWTHSDGGDPDAVTSGLGERWELEQITLRPWPVAAHLQNTVAAVLDLLESDPQPADEIARLELTLPTQAHSLHAAVGWDDRFRARLSARYVAAVVLHDRRCWLDQFTAERVADPGVRAFARDHVAVLHDPELPASAVALRAVHADGREVVVRRSVPKGDPADPLSRADLLEKLENAAAPRLPDTTVKQLLDVLPALDDQPDVSSIIRSLCLPATTRRTA